MLYVRWKAEDSTSASPCVGEGGSVRNHRFRSRNSHFQRSLDGVELIRLAQHGDNNTLVIQASPTRPPRHLQVEKVADSILK